MAHDHPGLPEPWAAIDLELSAEVARLVDLNVLSESQRGELWSDFRSAEQRAGGHLLAAGAHTELSPTDQVRAGLRARMWLAVAIEGAGTQHERAVEIRRRIVDLEKSLGVFEEPKLVERPGVIAPGYTPKIRHLSAQLRFSLVRWFHTRSLAGRTLRNHASSPTEGGLSNEAAPNQPLRENLQLATTNAMDPELRARVQDLGEHLRGKVVRDSVAGHSGYLLRFVDGEWVAAWLDPRSSRMDFLVGKGDPSATVTALLSNPAVADASAPLDVERLHASQWNDIAAEAAYTHQKQIVGVAIRVRAFSLCFPDGMELQGTVFTNMVGRAMMRVFWERW